MYWIITKNDVDYLIQWDDKTRFVKWTCKICRDSGNVNDPQDSKQNAEMAAETSLALHHMVKHGH